MKAFMKKAYNIFMKPEMMILPGQLAFFLILSIFPLLTLIGYVGSNISMFSSSFKSLMYSIFPTSVAEILIPFMSSGAITGNIAFFMIIGFYLISNGTNALIVTSNELFHIQHAPFLKRRTKAFFMIILLMALFIFNVLVLAYGNIIVREIISLNVFENIRLITERFICMSAAIRSTFKSGLEKFSSMMSSSDKIISSICISFSESDSMHEISENLLKASTA